MIRFDRRGLLRRTAAGLLAGSGLAVVTGCAVTSPTIIGGPTAPPTTPSPTPTPRLLGADQAYALETALADQAARLASMKLPAGQRQRIELVRTGHHQHALALAGPEPTTRPTGTPTPAPSGPPASLPALGTSAQKAVARLRAQEQQAAAGYAATARGTAGATALLWGSLSVSALMAGAALAGTSRVAAPPASGARAPLPALSDTQAATALLEQVHAIVFGYRAGIAVLSGTALTQADKELWQRMRLGDTLTAMLTGRGVTAPAAHAVYRLTVDPSSPAAARALFRAMEQRLLPYLGQWLAAADDDARPGALGALSDSGRAYVTWGGGPLTWPGWPD